MPSDAWALEADSRRPSATNAEQKHQQSRTGAGSENALPDMVRSVRLLEPLAYPQSTSNICIPLMTGVWERPGHDRTTNRSRSSAACMPSANARCASRARAARCITLQPDPPASFSRVPTTSRQCVTSTTILCTPHIYWPYKHITIAVRVFSPAHHPATPVQETCLIFVQTPALHCCFGSTVRRIALSPARSMPLTTKCCAQCCRSTTRCGANFCLKRR
jgi:hypothetical protein